MNRTHFLIAVGCTLAGMVLAWTIRSAIAQEDNKLQSSVVSRADAEVTTGDWGKLHSYFRGETPTTKKNLVLEVELTPGEALHSAHRHGSEEYLMITEGNGTWQLGEREFEANEGDVLYAAPWVYHGLTNTSDDSLTFVVVRFAGKGIEGPAHPDDGRPDELPESR